MVNPVQPQSPRLKHINMDLFDGGKDFLLQSDHLAYLYVLKVFLCLQMEIDR